MYKINSKVNWCDDNVLKAAYQISHISYSATTCQRKRKVYIQVAPDGSCWRIQVEEMSTPARALLPVSIFIYLFSQGLWIDDPLAAFNINVSLTKLSWIVSTRVWCTSCIYFDPFFFWTLHHESLSDSEDWNVQLAQHISYCWFKAEHKYQCQSQMCYMPIIFLQTFSLFKEKTKTKLDVGIGYKLALENHLVYITF